MSGAERRGHRQKGINFPKQYIFDWLDYRGLYSGIKGQSTLVLFNFYFLVQPEVMDLL